MTQAAIQGTFFTDEELLPYHEVYRMVGTAIIVVNKRGNTLSRGLAVLWRALDREDAKRLCSDPRSCSSHSFLAFVDDAYLASEPGRDEKGKWRWFWHTNDGRFNDLLTEMEIKANGQEAA